MPKQKTVRLRNSELDSETTVLPESVELWESRGWTVVDDGSSEEEPGQNEPEVTPSAHPQPKARQQADAPVKAKE
jgi:hypothetical protein